MDEKYATEIRKTGFVLESNVSEALRRAGWTVISNKYYEDDFEGGVREIDILAYKVAKVQQVNVYTTILISCKKSEPDIWALLARPIDLKNPNSDWWPLHAWSNDTSIAFRLEKAKIGRKYHEEIIALGVGEALQIPEHEVFAFQEMNRVSGAPHNDKNVFMAVTSLIKAQAYELSAMSGRKKDPSVYQFNLISIIDSELYRLVIDGDSISQKQIESEHYFSKYIIKKQETLSKIRFVSASAFEEVLKDYGKLHEANKKWFDSTIDMFYEGVLTDFRRVEVLISEFRSEVEWRISSAVREMDGNKIEKDAVGINWNAKNRNAEVYFWGIEPFLSRLNEDAELKKKVAAALKKVYRYTGEFVFSEDDIPF